MPQDMAQSQTPSVSENGADFICVGMFDFEVVNNVNTTIDVLANLNGRKRECYG
ncbi:MAG: hypothetical protein IT368_14655 [Candidatus Hydrogenedentes bacterium]|nr:hypothetical protein [Candidatus Hydrogenedentota bacterium]